MGAVNPHSWKKFNATAGATNTGISAGGVLDFTELNAITDPAVADTLALVDATDGVTRKCVISYVNTLFHAVAQMTNDLPNSLFLTYAEFDGGTTGAVDTKLNDALEAKGQLLAVFGIVTEVWNGTADSDVIISKAATGATPMASTITMDKDSVVSQGIGSVVGAWPVAGADSEVASAGDVYAYVASDVSRSTGKIGFILVWMKSA